MSVFRRMSSGRLEQKCFSWRRKAAVDRSSVSRVGSVFHARGAATEKALSPIRRRVGGTTRSPDDEARSTGARLRWVLPVLQH